MRENKRSIVLFEGNIAAGKTTIGRRLQESRLVNFIEEPVGHWQQGLKENALALFYQDPRRWALTFQFLAFMDRGKTWQKLLSSVGSSNRGEIIILERSLFCDRNVFAKNCYELGYMSKFEWGVYCELWNWLDASWPIDADRIIYLRVPAEICLERIKTRGRKEEQSITLSYLQELERLHDEWLLKDPKAIIVKGGSVSEEETYKKVVEALRG